MPDLFAEAARLLAGARRIAAFTGAGISAESGIPTYRGEGGLWMDYDPDKYANIDYFREDPSYYWRFFRDVRYDKLVGSRPNRAHEALAELETKGLVSDVITQNIDGLHQAAGSTRVIELHGNTRVIQCLKCSAEYGYEEIRKLVETELPPLCRACGGILKPKVVFFGEALPEEAIAAATEASSGCDVFLVVGSSLVVYPAAWFPILAKKRHASLVIINVGETGLDELADVRIDEKATVAFDRIMPLL